MGVVSPAGIVAVHCHFSAGQFHNGAHLADDPFFLGSHGTAGRGGEGHVTISQLHQTKVGGSLDEARHVHAHFLYAVGQSHQHFGNLFRVGTGQCRYCSGITSSGINDHIGLGGSIFLGEHGT